MKLEKTKGCALLYAINRLKENNELHKKNIF